MFHNTKGATDGVQASPEVAVPRRSRTFGGGPLRRVRVGNNTDLGHVALIEEARDGGKREGKG